MRFITSLFLILAILLGQTGSIYYAYADTDNERNQLIRQRRELMQILREEASSPSKLSELKMQLDELQNAIEEWKKQQLSERRRLLRIRRLELNRKRLAEPAASDEVSANESSHVETGGASYYADKFNGRTTASGAVFSNAEFTAAHRSLPFGTRLRVTNLNNDNVVEVMVNDRGPYVDGRVVDLSSAAFSALDNLSRGVIDVRIEVIN